MMPHLKVLRDASLVLAHHGYADLACRVDATRVVLDAVDEWEHAIGRNPSWFTEVDEAQDRVIAAVRAWRNV